MKRLTTMAFVLCLTVTMLFGADYQVYGAAAYTLKIEGASIPTTVTKGSYFNVKDKITSNYNLNSVAAGIYTTDGKTKYYYKQVNPASKSYTLYGSVVDRSLLFNKLGVGKYLYVVTASDVSGKKCTFVNTTFSVVGADNNPAPETAKSTLKIEGASKPSSITVGSYFDVKEL